MSSKELKKEKVLGLFDEEDIKHIRFDILEELEKEKPKENMLIKKIGDKDVHKK